MIRRTWYDFIIPIKRLDETIEAIKRFFRNPNPDPWCRSARADFLRRLGRHRLRCSHLSRLYNHFPSYLTVQQSRRRHRFCFYMTSSGASRPGRGLKFCLQLVPSVDVLVHACTVRPNVAPSTSSDRIFSVLNGRTKPGISLKAAVIAFSKAHKDRRRRALKQGLRSFLLHLNDKDDLYTFDDS
jgi:hypothetical protein